MSTYLLAISIGPVQDFIAAARRTADLYAGSKLLVEVAKTIANHIVLRKYGALIFPADPSTDGPNKVLAEITNGAPLAISEECRNAALDHLRTAWKNAKKEIPKSQFDENNADRQIDGFLEFYSAWLDWDGQSNTYENKCQQLDRLLAGRKALRDFSQPDKVDNRPKSPLDPSRDCVLTIRGTEAVPLGYRTHPLWLKHRESLDAVSLLKRVRGITNGLDVPSTSLVAFRAIEAEAAKKAPDAINFLNQKAKKAGKGIDLGDLMFESRSDEEELKDRGLEEADIEQIRAKRKEVLKAVGRSECPAYYAILAADGDRMGALIRELKTKENHQAFSQLLSTFAQQAKAIVETDHNGFLIYSGGDDVLALLPLNKALKCAAAIAGKFRELLTSNAVVNSAVEAVNKSGKPGGTLSVGIAIVHHMDPLLVSLENARNAEKEAKKLRNAFAVALHTRSGEPLTVPEHWNDQYTIEDWEKWIDAFRNGIARGFPYELRTLAREFQAEGMPTERLQTEANRIYERKEKKSTLPLPDFEKSPWKLESFAKKLVIARFLSTYEVKP